jgi:S-adenosylhomocysteine hydrolase
MNEEEFDWCIEQTLTAFEGGQPLNMILDDGGDLTNMVLDRFPEMVEGLLKVFLKKRLLVFIDYMKELRKELFQCLLSMLTILLLSQSLITSTDVKSLV